MFGRKRPPRPTHDRIKVPTRTFPSLRESQSQQVTDSSDLGYPGKRERSELTGYRAKDSDLSSESSVEERSVHSNWNISGSPLAHPYATQSTSRQRAVPSNTPQPSLHPFPDMPSNRSGLPVSSSSAGATPSLRKYHSPVRKWVWTAFTFNVALAAIFAALCASSYKTFTEAVDQLDRGETAGFPAGSKASDWQQLFVGAAVSAAFAIVLTIVFHACALALLLCSFKSLADPHRRFGRAFVMSAAIFIGLHILNIALQFRGYGPTLSTWHSQYGAPFNTMLLNTCVIFGLLSFLNYSLLGGLLFFWQDPEDVYLLERREMYPAGVQL